MHQQQVLSPVTLAQRYAELKKFRKWPKAVWISLLCFSGILIFLAQVDAMPLRWFVHGPLVFLFFFSIPKLLLYKTVQQKIESLYTQLLTLLKDETISLTLSDRVAVLAALPASSQPPLLGLAQARLAQKLAYASPAELAALPRAPLHAWLRDLETPDDLRISLLLALGTLHDHAIRPLAQEIAQIAPTERLHEAALECLKSLESAP